MTFYSLLSDFLDIFYIFTIHQISQNVNTYNYITLIRSKNEMKTEDRGLIQRTFDRGQRTVMEVFPPLYYGKTLIIFNSLQQSRQLLAFVNHQSFMIDNIMIFRSAAEKNPPSLSIVLCQMSSLRNCFVFFSKLLIEDYIKYLNPQLTL